MPMPEVRIPWSQFIGVPAYGFPPKARTMLNTIEELLGPPVALNRYNCSASDMNNWLALAAREGLIRWPEKDVLIRLLVRDPA